MKIKKLLLTILLALVAILLLQAQVKAEEINYSQYDYLLTEGGIIAQENLTGTEAIIAGIKGEYTGEITADNTNKKVTINNFTAEELYIFNAAYELWIEGENCIDIVDYEGSLEINAKGNGKIKTYSVISSDIVGSSIIDSGLFIFYFGDSIDSSATSININLTENHLDSSGKVLDEVAQKISNLLKIEGARDYYLDSPDNTIIPACIFAALKEGWKELKFVYGDIYYLFEGYAITNTNADFKVGFEYKQGEPIEDMTDLNATAVRYLSFNNSGSFPGPVFINFPYGYGDRKRGSDVIHIFL